MIVVCISGEVTGGGLTFGKKYDVIKHNIREDSFLLINDNDDNNKFVGISKRNYLGGSPNFIELTKLREFKLNTILE